MFFDFLFKKSKGKNFQESYDRVFNQTITKGRTVHAPALDTGIISEELIKRYDPANWKQVWDFLVDGRFNERRPLLLEVTADLRAESKDGGIVDALKIRTMPGLEGWVALGLTSEKDVYINTDENGREYNSNWNGSVYLAIGDDKKPKKIENLHVFGVSGLSVSGTVENIDIYGAPKEMKIVLNRLGELPKITVKNTKAKKISVQIGNGQVSDPNIMVELLKKSSTPELLFFAFTWDKITSTKQAQEEKLLNRLKLADDELFNRIDLEVMKNQERRKVTERMAPPEKQPIIGVVGKRPPSDRSGGRFTR